jgi:hypothetical protein
MNITETAKLYAAQISPEIDAHAARACSSSRSGLADAGGARRAFDKRKILYNMKASEIRLIDKLEEGLHNGNSTSYEQNRCTYAQDSGFRRQ